MRTITNKNKIAKPAPAFIVLGVLKGYIKRSGLFLLKTILTFSQFKKRTKKILKNDHNLDLPNDFIDSAAFMAWLYIRLQCVVSQERALELTSIMCSIDNAIFNTYLPEKITFHRRGLNNTMVDGAGKCIFVVENNEA